MLRTFSDESLVDKVRRRSGPTAGVRALNSGSPGVADPRLELGRRRAAGNGAVTVLVQRLAVQRGGCGSSCACGGSSECPGEERGAEGSAPAVHRQAEGSGGSVATGTARTASCAPFPAPLGLGTRERPKLIDEHVAGGARCRGACGEGCSNRACTDIGTYLVRHEQGGCHYVIEYRNAKRCGTHTGCRWHDDCFDRAKAMGERYVTEPEHMKCNLRIAEENAIGDWTSWMLGGPPYEEEPMYFVEQAIVRLETEAERRQREQEVSDAAAVESERWTSWRRAGDRAALDSARRLMGGL
jgi:hypothetical protein